jgi:hypothetical protein
MCETPQVALLFAARGIGAVDLATSWVLVELRPDQRGAYRNASIGEVAFAAPPRAGEFVNVRPEHEDDTFVFEVIAVVHAPIASAPHAGDLILRRIRNAVELQKTVRQRMGQK